jgi:hypothetical protein
VARGDPRSGAIVAPPEGSYPAGALDHDWQAGAAPGGLACGFKRKQIRDIEDARTLRRGNGDCHVDRHDPQQPGSGAVSHSAQCPSACLGLRGRMPQTI